MRIIQLKGFPGRIGGEKYAVRCKRYREDAASTSSRRENRAGLYARLSRCKFSVCRLEIMLSTVTCCTKVRCIPQLAAADELIWRSAC